MSKVTVCSLIALFVFVQSLFIGLHIATRKSEKNDPHSSQITELHEKIAKMQQQLIVVSAKIEGRPQSCGVRDWLTFDGRLQ